MKIKNEIFKFLFQFQLVNVPHNISFRWITIQWFKRWIQTDDGDEGAHVLSWEPSVVWKYWIMSEIFLKDGYGRVKMAKGWVKIINF